MKKSPNTRACIFGTLHVPATEILMEQLDKTGIKAMVGKVNMDRNGGENLCEADASAAAEDTKKWIEETAGKYERTNPILTPRFIPSCTDELMRELAKLQKNLGGIKEMKRLPDAIFIVDPKKERICVQEAHTLGIPLIGICDTNCDPEELDYVIPGNDDAIRAVKLIVSKMADAVIEANQGAEEAVAEEAAETEEAAE